MLKKEQLKGLSTPTIAFLAKLPAVEGQETASTEVVATTFRDEAGDLLVSNDMPQTYSPFTGKALKAIAGAEAQVSLNDEDFKDGALALACTCQNEKCGVELYTGNELASMFNGEEFHCVVCATVNTIQVAAADEQADAAVETPAVAAPAVEADPVETPSTTEQAADGGELSDDEVDEIIDNAASEDDEEYDENDEDEEYSEEDAAAKAEAEAAAAAAEEEASTEDEQITEVLAGVGTELVVDLTSQYDFRPETLQLAALNQDFSRIAVFAYSEADGESVCIAYLNRDAANEDLQPLFHKDKLRNLRDAVIAANSAEDDVSVFGLEHVTATIRVDDEVKRQITEARDQFTSEHASAADNYAENFMKCVDIAMAGMMKGTYSNPLLVEVTAGLEQLGVENAGEAAIKIVENAGNQFALAALERVEELMNFSEEARAAVAATIDQRDGQLQPIKTKRSESIVATAHLEIPSTQVRGQEEDRKTRPISSLFSYENIGSNRRSLQ